MWWQRQVTLQELLCCPLQPSTSADVLTVRAALLNYKSQFQGPCGAVDVRALSVAYIPKTADLLTVAFVGATRQLRLYTEYLRRNIGNYLREHQVLPQGLGGGQER